MAQTEQMIEKDVAPPAGPPETRRHGSPSLADWKSLLLVVAIAFVNAVSFQGSRGLYETTEGRYAECARETMLSGDIDDPILNNAPHWTKPPLTYVAIGAGIWAFGENPWGVRAYLVLAMVLAAAAVWWTGVSIWGPSSGRWAGIIFSTSPLVAATATSVSTDMLVTLWTALTLAAFWHGRAARSRWAAWLMWVFAGLGCLTKGPPALLVPIVALPCAGWLLKRAGSWRPGTWTTLAGLGIFLIVGLGWYATEITEHPELAIYWLGQELVARNLTDEFHRNPGVLFIFTVYLPMLVFGTGHWLLLILLRWRRSFHGLPLSRLDSSAWNDAARWSLLAGIALPFAVFSFSHSRLALYLAPLFVPMCLLLGRGLDILLSQGGMPRRLARVSAGTLLLVIVAVKAIAAISEQTCDMTALASHLAPVLGRVRPDALYSVGNKYLNGLKFHLRRDVVPVDLALFDNQLHAQYPLPPHSFYVIKKKNWSRMATNVAAAVHVEELGPRWVGIWPSPMAQ